MSPSLLQCAARLELQRQRMAMGTPGRAIRNLSSALQFYRNRQLELYADKETKRLTLRQLVFFGRSMNEERLIQSANYVRTELPVRLAHRLRDMQLLPYIVVTEDHIASVYELYWTAWESLRKYPPITTIDENTAFCEFMRGLLDEHSTVIPKLSLGLSLSSPHLAPEYLDTFMRRMLVSRISRRVLTEHHIALTEALAARARSQDTTENGNVGIISTALSVRSCVENCVQSLRARALADEDDAPVLLDKTLRCGWPEVIIDGHVDTKFAYIREHVEYIVFEILKNSMRATLALHPSTSPPPPIRTTIAENENSIGIRISDQGGGLLTTDIQCPDDLFSFSHTRNSARMDNTRLIALRTASSNPDGVRGKLDQQIQMWQERTNVRRSEVGRQPRLGVGLPLSSIFARYLGGSLELVSLDGWGTDAYIRLPKLGRVPESIEL